MNEKLEKKKSEKKEGSLTIRAFIVYVCVALASIGVFYRIIDLQFSKKAELRNRSEVAGKTLEMVEIPVERGTILSRDNEVLVQRLPRYIIAMDTYPVEKIKNQPDSIKILLPDSVFNAQITALADSITKLFGERNPSWEVALKKARAEKKRYFVISDKASISECLQVQEFPLFRDQKDYNALCKVKGNLKYVINPYGNLARRTLGYVSGDSLKNKNTTFQKEQDGITLVGLEGYFNTELSGTPGKVLRKYISNVAIDLESDENVKPSNGFDITTTLNVTYQDIAHNTLMNSLREFNADEGCVIVMEVATGDILAMANIGKDKLGLYGEIKNIALTQYEPGSTFKTASLLVALNDGKVTPNTPVSLGYSSGRTAKVGHRNVVDDHAIAINNPELWYIFAQSSNVGTTKAIYDYYASNQQQFIDGLYKLGFGDTLRFPIVGGDMKPLLRNPSHPRWSKTSISTIPMGYELQVTPLHLLTFYNAIANNGCMVAPRLVSKIASKDTTKIYQVDTLNAQICSGQALQYIRSMLDSVVTCGTGRKGFTGAPYTVAGKTGTSKIYSPDAKGQSLYNASFCGYFPADNPKYSCIVVIKKPRAKSIYGGTVALPVFREIADKIYATDYDLMPKAEAMSQDANTDNIPLLAKVRSKTLETIFKGINFNKTIFPTSEWLIYSDGQCQDVVAFSKDIIPDVIGMSLTDAVYVLEKAGIATEVKGYGRVKKQSPEANTPLQKNQKVVLELDMKS